MALTQQQIDIVKSTVPILQQHGTEITTVMYSTLLAAHPHLRSIFSLRSQATGAQPTALAHAVLAYAAHVDDLAKLAHAVERISQKHASLFVRPEHYPVVGEHLIGAMGTVLGDALTDGVRSAWAAAFAALADIFVAREAALYAADGGWSDWRQFRIARKVAENEAVASFYLEPVEGGPLPSYLPGQYISVQVPVPQAGGGIKQSRQFSLSEAPTPGLTHYRVSVKREETLSGEEAQSAEIGTIPGLISNILHRNYSEGDIVEVSAPHGEFFVDPAAPDSADKPLVLLSAGVGATPMRSILDAVLASPSGGQRSITWVHAARSTGTSLFIDHVREVAAQHSNMTAKVFVKNLGEGDVQGRTYDFDGRIDLPRLKQLDLLQLDSDMAEYFICGPESWMLHIRAWLEGQGVAIDRLHLELFSPGDVA